jgi:hypothetical protein
VCKERPLTTEEERQYERLRQALLEYLNSAIDTQKNLATLCAGSLVLIGTFLKDIFSATALECECMSGSIIKLLIVLSFLFFTASLGASAWLIGRFRTRLFEVAKAAGSPTRDDNLEKLIGSPDVIQRKLRYESPRVYRRLG